jgi:hypothetical protein
MDEPNDPPPAGQWPEPPPFTPDLDLIGDLERGQAAALRHANVRGWRRFWPFHRS